MGSKLQGGLLRRTKKQTFDFINSPGKKKEKVNVTCFYLHFSLRFIWTVVGFLFLFTLPLVFEIEWILNWMNIENAEMVLAWLTTRPPPPQKKGRPLPSITCKK